MKQLGSQPSSLQNRNTPVFGFAFIAQPPPPMTSIPTARAALFVRDSSGDGRILKSKSVATDRRRAKWNRIDLLLLFRFLGILSAFENSNDCPKIWTLLFKLSYSL
jgi:hypothetical protein